MIKYFIAYEYQTKNGRWKTNAVVETPVPIKSIDDINAIQDLIMEKKPNYQTVVILNIVRLED
jgi:hypothetical protein